jgi:hypothetical protein
LARFFARTTKTGNFLAKVGNFDEESVHVV